VVMVKLEKTFTHAHSEATKEKSDDRMLPPGKIIGWLIISPADAYEDVFWWVEIEGHMVLPSIATDGHQYLTTGAMSGFVADVHPAWKTPRNARLVGWNDDAATDYRIQVGIVIEPEE